MNHIRNIAGLLSIHAAFASVQAGDLPDIRKTDNRVLVASHRANYGEAPENSLEAIKACIEGGVDMVELDVARTRDGKLVLMHDKTVDRTTTGSGKIEAMQWAQVRELRLRRRGKSDALTEETVPSLEAALKLCKDKVYVNLDLKGPTIYDCIEVIRETETAPMIVYRGTFRPSSIAHLVNLGKRLPRMHLSPRIDFRKAYFTWPGDGTGLAFCKPYLDAVDVWGFDIPFKSLSHPAVSRGNLRALNELNVRVWALTLNSVCYGGFRDRDALKQPAAVWGKLIDHGVSVIMTDEPEALITYLNALSPLDREEVEQAPRKRMSVQTTTPFSANSDRRRRSSPGGQY